MKRLLFTAVLAAAGCGGLDNADEFRNASPSRQGIEIKVPSSGQALESSDIGQEQQALLGQQAALYSLTRSVTRVVNGGTAAWLALCEAIVSYPPTTLDDTHAVWGPWTDALSPNTYRFTVTKNGASYDYVFEGKAKADPDSAFLALITGRHEPGRVAKQGKGSFTANWDTMQKLPEHGQDVGSADFTYERNAHLDVTVGVKFHQVRDNDNPGQRNDASYGFSQIAGGDGSFDFVSTNAMSQRWSVKSRWQSSGAGRSDVKAQNPDGSTLGTVAECWGPTFLETYYVESWNALTKQGAESACVFPTAEYSTL